MKNRDLVEQKALRYFDNDVLAAKVIQKYLLSSETEFIETHPREVLERLAKEFARIEAKYGGPYALSEADIYSYTAGFNSILLQGSPMAGIGNTQQLTSLSNCVVIESPKDSLSGIFNTGSEMANLFKNRGGVGVDISTLRPRNSSVDNSAKTSTGAVSFADFFSTVSRLVGQNGRRAALMISMDVTHPDILEFIEAKRDLTKITGANLSVRTPDAFWEAVQNNEDWELKWPVDSDTPKYSRKIKAKAIADAIAQSAAASAEPGVLFWDNITGYLPAHRYKELKTISTNPCGELPLSANDSCRLGAINVSAFVYKKQFNFRAFEEQAAVLCRLGDDLVDLELEKVEQLIHKNSDSPKDAAFWEKFHETGASGRRLGLGTLGWGDLFYKMEIAYGSYKSIQLADKIMRIYRDTVYRTSIILAKERGTFPLYNARVEEGDKFLARMFEDSPELKDLMSTYGRRNVSILTNAPTGSIAILAKTSSGIEPVFALSYTRRKKIAPNEQIAEKTKVITAEDGERFVEYTVLHPYFEEWLKANKEWENKDAYLYGDKKLPDFFVVAQDINWRDRVNFQSTVQYYIDHSISSTINLPKNTPAETIYDIYIESWRKGLKGVTVYVDGSRQPLIVVDKKNSNTDGAQGPSTVYKRPEKLACSISTRSSNGQDYLILLGKDENGYPREIFTGKCSSLTDEQCRVLRNHEGDGFIRKISYKTKPNEYELIIDGNVVIKDIPVTLDNPDYYSLTRFVSLSLAYGIPMDVIVKQLHKTHASKSFSSLPKVIARELKHWISDGVVVTDKVCPNCKVESLRYVDGCIQCSNCGWSQCS